MSGPNIEVHPTFDAVAAAGAERVVLLCAQALAERETFTLCLAGGGTPKAMYELLAGEHYNWRVKWPRVEIFFGDERCVPPEHPDSNYGMAKAALLDHVPIPGDNIYRMKGEIAPEAAAKEYGRMLKDRFGTAEVLTEVARQIGPELVTSRFSDGRFDLLLLGMGEDGHTLSLFPGTAAVAETKHRCVANFVPKLNEGRGAWRLSITAPFANRSANVLALVAGANKAAPVREVLEGDASPQDYPIKLIDPGPGRFTMLLDAAAAGMDEE